MKIIKFDVSFYLLILLTFLCGNFKNILILYLIIIVHEIGHIIFIKLFNKNIVSIKFYAFGGISKYNTLVNHQILEELLIAIGGILNQMILFIIFKILYSFNIINIYTYKLFINNNLSLLLFNLIPMIGLDGEKIIHLLLEYILPYYLVNKIMIIVSILSIIIFIIGSISYKINIIYVSIFFIYKLIDYLKNNKYLVNKFYLERYMYDLPYRKITYLNNDNIKNMYQDRYHFFNNIREYEVIKRKYARY